MIILTYCQLFRWKMRNISVIHGQGNVSVFFLLMITFIFQILWSPFCDHSPLLYPSWISWSGSFLFRTHWNSGGKTVDSWWSWHLVGSGCYFANNRKSCAKRWEQLDSILLNKSVPVRLPCQEYQHLLPIDSLRKAKQVECLLWHS